NAPVRNSAHPGVPILASFSRDGNGRGRNGVIIRVMPQRRLMGRNAMGLGLCGRMLIAAGIAVLAGSAVAQQPPVRVRGEIEKVDGNTLIVKGRDGSSNTINMAENVRVMAFVKASLADIKPNSYIGVTAMPQADGSQKAI